MVGATTNNWLRATTLSCLIIALAVTLLIADFSFGSDLVEPSIPSQETHTSEVAKHEQEIVLRNGTTTETAATGKSIPWPTIVIGVGICALIIIFLATTLTELRKDRHSSLPADDHLRTRVDYGAVRVDDPQQLPKEDPPPIGRQTDSNDNSRNTADDTVAPDIIVSSIATLGQKIDDMKTYFMTFNNKIDAKEQELKRYKEGYDHKLLNKYIKPFCRTHQKVERMLEKSQGFSKELESIRDTLMDAIERCGIETFIPEINDRLHHQMGNLVDDRPETVLTADKTMDGRICKVLNPGYRCSQEPHTVILSANVSIYHYNN